MAQVRQQAAQEVNQLEQATQTAQQSIDEVARELDQQEREREARNKKILDFIEENGTEPMRKLARKLR